MGFIEKVEKLSKNQLVLLLLVAGAVVYFNSLFNGFVWDDEEQIVKNPLVQSWSNIPLIFKSSTFYGGGAAPTGWFYRPMMTLSYLINWNLWGGRAFGFHLFQVIIHLLNSILIFGVFEGILGREKIPRVKLPSFFVALIFAVHPGNVEAVAYIAALQESLYTLFILLIFFIFLRVWDKEKRGGGWGLWGTLGILGLLAFLSKEVSVFIIPLFSVFLIFYQKKHLVYWLVSSFSALFVYFFLRLMVAKIPITPVNIGPVAESPLWQRLMTIPYALGSYLRIIFFPKDLLVSQHTLITSVTDFRFWGYLGVLGGLGILGVWVGVRLRSKLFFFFTFWFLGSLSLVLNIIPLDMTVAERWLYFPLIGFLGVLGSLGTLGILGAGKAKNLGVFLAMAIIIGFSGRTMLRNFDWKNGLTLYGHDVQFNEEAFDLENNYGVELFRVGQIEEAKKHFQRSIELYPRWWFTYNNLGAVYERDGDWQKAEEFYQKSLEISDYYLAYENLGFLLLRVGKKQEAETFLRTALGKFPHNSRLKVAMALAFYYQGKQKEAENLARQAFILQPTAEIQAILGAILSKKPISF